VKILNGRWGPYIAVGKTNYKIPKDTEPAGLSFEEVQKIIGESDKKGSAKTKPKAKAKSTVRKKTAKATPKSKASASKTKKK
jgi:DNA topoisomerase I